MICRTSEVLSIALEKRYKPGSSIEFRILASISRERYSALSLAKEPADCRIASEARGEVTKTLLKRIERLERAGGTDLEIGIRAFARRFGIPAEPLLATAERHCEQLANQVWPDGSLTFEALGILRTSGAFDRPARQ